MRIGINVPNELLERVKAIRPEVNVSQVCREALEEYVHKSDRIAEQVAVDKLDEHITRLAESDLYPLVEPDWEGFALEDARDWLSKATHKDWDAFCDNRDFLKRNRREDETWFADVHGIDDVRRFWHRKDEHEDWLLYQYEVDWNSSALADAREKYEHTWIAYLEEVRRLWEQRRREEREKVMAERRKNWQTLKEPKIPPQLQEW